MKLENQHTFNKILETGVNLFLGAGFSVLAKDASDKHLPVGSSLKDELVEIFNREDLKSLPLDKIATILIRSKKDSFENYIRKRFTVNEFSEKYYVLDKFDLRSVFTTNVDNLLFKIFEKSKHHYLNDLDSTGPSLGDRRAIDIIALHGHVLKEGGSLTFGSLDIASAFHTDSDRWHFLTQRIQSFPTIFWGYGMNDAGTLEALNPKTIAGRKHQGKWVVLRPGTEEADIEYFQALDFQLIIADTEELLDYIGGLDIDFLKKEENRFQDRTKELFPKEAIPDLGSVPVRPILEFFLGSAPRWCDIFSGQLKSISYYSNVIDSVNSGLHTIAVGLPASGKTTLLMQLSSEIKYDGHKLVCDSPTLEKAKYIVNRLNGQKALICIDNFTDSVMAFHHLSIIPNIQLVGFDRDYNFDIVSHKIDLSKFNVIDITELTDPDIQGILSTIPKDLKNPYAPKSWHDAVGHPSIFEIIESNISKARLARRFRTVFDQLSAKDENLIDLLIVCCYVHQCRTPVSLDMLIAYFRDKTVSYSDLYKMTETLGSMLDDYGGYLADTEQDHFVPRSTIVAEAILSQTPQAILKRVVHTFTIQVSPARICRYDIFRRKAYDSDLMSRVFPFWEEGKNFYEMMYDIDRDNPHLRQQGALYLASRRRFKEAFLWIDEAIIKSRGRIPSIKNSHAIILFKANIDGDIDDPTVRSTLQRSMEILKECYIYDKRKTYHALTFADQAIKYWDRYPSDEAIEFLKKSNSWLTEEQKKFSWNRNVRRLKKEIQNLLTRIR